MLAAAGVTQPARVAALLDLEPEAVVRAAELGRAGTPEGELVARVQDALAETLAQACVELGRFEDAERVVGAALQVAEARGRPAFRLLFEQGRAQAGLGRFAEAERAFRRALAERPHGADGATVRRELTRCLIALGRFEEAAKLVDQDSHGPARN